VTTLPIHFHTDNADEEEEKLPTTTTTTWRSSRIPPRARDVSSPACVPRTRVYWPPLSFSLFFSALPPTWNSVFQPPSNVGRRWRPRLFEGAPSSRHRLFLPFCFYPSSATYLSSLTQHSHDSSSSRTFSSSSSSISSSCTSSSSSSSILHRSGKDPPRVALHERVVDEESVKLALRQHYPAGYRYLGRLVISPRVRPTF